MNFFRRLQSLFSLPKWKCPKIHRRQPEISDKHCNQVGLGKKGARPHLVQDNRGKLPHFEHNAYLEELSARIQRELDETAAWIQHDLDETAAWIQRDLDKTAAWIQRDLDETAAWIQGDLDETATWIKCDLEKIESQIQQAPKLPEDKVQGDPEELATQIKRELEKLIAQLSLEGKVEQNQPKLEGKDEQIQCDLDETEAWIQSDLDETAFWIQCDLDKTAAWIQCDLDKTAAMIQLDLTKLEYDIQRDLTVPVDKIQGDLEDVSAHIQKDLNDLVAQLQFKQPKLEEKAALIPCDPEVKPATPHRDLVESPISISLENFVLHKVLGKGTFGKVMLAELKESGECFAMKALSKGSVLTNGYTHYTMIEKRVLKLAAENPFLVHLHSTFQTKDNLFFVMEYITGGDLFSLLEKKRRFDLVTTRFYAAELICGLQFLHRNGVIYRDLKLDNVMLDGDGHIKIVDFGLCRDNMFGDKRATSFCGSEHYIAPEIYQKREYSFAVDWWSFGVLLFEMLTGRAPFYGADYDELYMSVCWDIPPYPSWVKNKSKDLLIKLLDRDPRCRLGATGNIRAHSFFESIDWPALERREVEPPFKPEMEGHKDCSAFDKELLNEAPKLSQGDSKSIGPMDQSAFADFSFINPKCTYLFSFVKVWVMDATIKLLRFGFTLCPDFLKIYQKREYSFAVDWWSFGVLLFEMLTGRAPFYGADYDELYMSVCWDIPPYPSWVKNKSKDLLIKLLDRDPRCRLGATGNIRAHSFFESIDWPALERREVEPPFKPEMEGHKDCSAFDKELLNEAPKLSQGDSKSIGPMDQSAFADFSFINPKWCRAQ